MEEITAPEERPEELDELVRDMRDDVLGPAEVERVLRNVSAAVTPTGGSGGGPAQPPRWVSLVAVGVVTLGALGGWMLLRTSGRPLAPPVASVALEPLAMQGTEPSTEPPAEPPTQPSTSPSDATEVRTRDARTIAQRTEADDVRPPSAGPSRPPLQDAAHEHALLTEARRVATEDPTRALELAEAHRRAFPRGLLAPEREMIAIDALVLLGRDEAARARAQRFVRRWPASTYTTRLVERGLAGS